MRTRLLLWRARRNGWIWVKSGALRIRLASRAVALADSPKQRAEALTVLAYARSRAADPAGAELAAVSALQIIAEADALSRAEANIELATALLAQGKTDDALIAARQAQSHPANAVKARALRVIGGSLAALGRDEEAIEELRSAIELGRRFPFKGMTRFAIDHCRSQTQLVRLLRGRGQHEEALRMGRENIGDWQVVAVLGSPRWRAGLANARMEMCQTLADAGATAEAMALGGKAIGDLRRIGNAKPSLAWMLWWRSGRLAAEGKLVESLADLEESVRLHQELEAAEPGKHRQMLVVAMGTLIDRQWQVDQGNSRPVSLAGRWLRATVLQESDQRDALHQEVKQAGGWRQRGQIEFIRATFELAVRRRFAAILDDEAVDHLVNEVARVFADGAPPSNDVDTLIRAAISDTTVDPTTIDLLTVMRTGVLVIVYLFKERGYTVDELDRLIVAGEQLAKQRGWTLL